MYVAAILFSRSTLHRDALPCVPNKTLLISTKEVNITVKGEHITITLVNVTFLFLQFLDLQSLCLLHPPHLILWAPV